MRFGQIVALFAVLAEAWLMLDFSWDETGNPAQNSDGFAIVVALGVLLVFSEFVRVGRWTSITSLMWLGHMTRFTGLAWAVTGFIALVIAWIAPNVATPVALLWIAGGFAVATSFYAFSLGRTKIIVRNFEITRAHGSSGDVVGKQYKVRITVLSDLHLGTFISLAHVRRAVEISNHEAPDIVLLLGDYVDEDGSLARELVAELTLLEAKLGVFAVLGNHDIECRDSQRLIDELDRDHTVSLLRNSSALVEIGPAPEVDSGGTAKIVQIVGIESPGDEWLEDLDVFGKETLNSELSGAAADFTIVASHHPEAFGPSAKYSVDLVVAGHTHGGQLAVPFAGRILSVGRLVTKYFLGLYELGTTRLIVTAGIGVGVIPARIGVPPEVVVVQISFD
ncbi:MAG: metallophosphoesterase [Chloroflexi bacterium]|nr:metallophosphoesterase [Chloroflexota bacterium]